MRKTPGRKKAQPTANIIAELATAQEEVGGMGFIKVLLPDGLATHRVVEVLPTMEDDIILVLEKAPCWRRKLEDSVPRAENPWKWVHDPSTTKSFTATYPLSYDEGRLVMVYKPGHPIAIAHYQEVTSTWYDAFGKGLGYWPERYATIPMISLEAGLRPEEVAK